MTSCVNHGLRLVPEWDVTTAVTLGKPLAVELAPAPVVVLDRYTHQGLTTGTIVLPGRSTYVGVWFRMLRILLHEVSVAPARVGVRSAEALRRIWQSTDGPIRRSERVAALRATRLGTATGDAPRCRRRGGPDRHR